MRDVLEAERLASLYIGDGIDQARHSLVHSEP
jgi:hypothetical protein